MQIVSSSSELNSHIQNIYNSIHNYIILDTEFVREKTYFPTVGLIQCCYEGGEFILDPVDYRYDYTEFVKLLEDEKIEKVLHACGQDIEIFYNDLNARPKNIFDTQIAAKLLGFGEAASLNKLTEDYLELTLDKTQRYTDWTKRPLDPEQIEYAFGDVVHLRDVYKKIKHELEERGRYKWAVEESEKAASFDNFIVNPDDAWQKAKIKSQDKKYLCLLKSLCRWREFTAQNQNRPRGWILKDDAIQEIATVKPKDIDDLKGLRFFRFSEKLAHEILGIVDYALSEETPPTVKKKTKAPAKLEPVISMLKIILKNQSIKHDIAPSVIANADDLKEIALENFDETNVMKGFRYEIFGKFAEKLVKSQLALIVEKNEVIMIEPEITE